MIKLQKTNTLYDKTFVDNWPSDPHEGLSHEGLNLRWNVRKFYISVMSGVLTIYFWPYNVYQSHTGNKQSIRFDKVTSAIHGSIKWYWNVLLFSLWCLPYRRHFTKLSLLYHYQIWLPDLGHNAPLENVSTHLQNDQNRHNWYNKNSYFLVKTTTTVSLRV